MKEDPAGLCHVVTAAVCRFGRKDPCYCAALAYCYSLSRSQVDESLPLAWQKIGALGVSFSAPSLLSFGLPSCFSIFFGFLWFSSLEEGRQSGSSSLLQKEREMRGVEMGREVLAERGRF
ncbi:hypothetical protein H0E87_028272 [Populus deltoides]|uniref:Uncharacterized protein n=1 Tax=Populus deltoides TaxID=3696 RepID=A0A8T2WUX7_POPDE|nr:hypothetical protein H0E87_028272 [Populus deltoides]